MRSRCIPVLLGLVLLGCPGEPPPPAPPSAAPAAPAPAPAPAPATPAADAPAPVAKKPVVRYYSLPG